MNFFVHNKMDGEEGVPPNRGNENLLKNQNLPENHEGESDLSYGTFETREEHVPSEEPISFEEKVAQAVSRILEEKEKQASQLAEMKIIEEKKYREQEEEKEKKQKEIESKENQARIDREKLQLLSLKIKAYNLGWISLPIYLVGLTLFILGIKYFYWSPTSWIMVPIGLILWIPLYYSVGLHMNVADNFRNDERYGSNKIATSTICEMIWATRLQCLETHYKQKWQNWVNEYMPDYQELELQIYF